MPRIEVMSLCCSDAPIHTLFRHQPDVNEEATAINIGFVITANKTLMELAPGTHQSLTGYHTQRTCDCGVSGGKSFADPK